MVSSIRYVGNKITGLFSKLIPSVYSQDLAAKRSIYIWLLIGVLIRFTFMPIALHFDLLSIYQRSAQIAYEGDMGMGLGQIFAHYIHAFFLFIFKPLMPYLETALPGRGGSASWLGWRAFIMYPTVFRTLFLFKAPYLIFDLGSAFLLLAILKNRRKGLIAFKFWMLNPVIIFSAFIFSRYEPIVIFFILLSLYYAKNNLSARALFSLGIAVIVRSYPLMLVPFFVIIIGKTFWQRLKLASWGLLPLGIMTVVSRLSRGAGQIGEIGAWANMYHTNYLMALRWPMRISYDMIFVFFMGYTILFLYTYFRTNHSFAHLWKINLILLLFFFATCFFHPHYFMWLIPFLALQVVEDKRFIGLFAIQILGWIVYTFQWKEALAGYLFAPLNYSYFTGLRSPFELIGQYYSAANFIGIFRSIFSGVSFWMVYLLFKEFSLVRRKEKG